MNYKHYIITRFMCDNFIKNLSKVDITSNTWKEMSFDMAQRHIIPTLENQTNTNFTLVFLVSDNITIGEARRIKCLSNIFEIKVVKLSEFDNFIKSVDSDYLITSRLDYDDHIYRNCVRDLHYYFNTTDIKVKLYGLNQGISIIDGETEGRLLYNFPWTHNEGFPAPMPTLILKRECCKEYFDIYKLGFHTDVVKNFMAVQSYYLNDIYEQQEIRHQHNAMNIDYIWIRHPNSATAIVHNSYHTTNIRVELNKLDLKELFGYIPY